MYIIYNTITCHAHCTNCILYIQYTYPVHHLALIIIIKLYSGEVHCTHCIMYILYCITYNVYCVMYIVQ